MKIMKAAVSLFHRYHSLKLFYVNPSYLECTVQPILPISDVLQCSMDESCLAIKCCIQINIKITTLLLKAWISIDPCKFEFSIGFENFKFNQTLFSYNWGAQEQFHIGEYLTFRYWGTLYNRISISLISL